MSAELLTWMEQVTGPEWVWYVKYLSGNDTLANGTHQAGPYVPKDLIFALFPSLKEAREENPRAEFGALIDSHNVAVWATVIWYNNRLRGGTRNECRITNWGGSASPLLDPESTGSLCVFAFHKPDRRDVDVCQVWLCRTPQEEELVLDRAGPIEPGVGRVHRAGDRQLSLLDERIPDSPCSLSDRELKVEWLLEFPEAQQIVQIAVSRLPSATRHSPDERLLARRECEFEIFRSIEKAAVLPRIKEGFATVDLFVDFANIVTNRRKARSGASLELQTRRVFDEEKLPYSHDEVSENRKRPDFLFPSAEAYRDAKRAPATLRMLAAKTTCKDRWRQILNEADRIDVKHLLTLQHGVSIHQFKEMQDAKVQLVVPAKLISKYPEPLHDKIMTLSQFIESTRIQCSDSKTRGRI